MSREFFLQTLVAAVVTLAPAAAGAASFADTPTVAGPEWEKFEFVTRSLMRTSVTSAFSDGGITCFITQSGFARTRTSLNPAGAPAISLSCVGDSPKQAWVQWAPAPDGFVVTPDGKKGGAQATAALDRFVKANADGNLICYVVSDPGGVATSCLSFTKFK